MIARGVVEPEGCRGLGSMPLIKVFSGNGRELLAVGNDVAMDVEKFIKFPIGASPIEQLACFTKVPPVEAGMLPVPIKLCEFGLKFGTMSSMQKLAEVFDFSGKMRREI